MTVITARATRKRAWSKVGLWVALLAGAVFAGGPVLWMLSSSFKSNADIFAYPPRLISKSFSAMAYAAVFNDPQELRFFVNSYVVGLSVTALTILVAILAAYAFSRYEFRLRQPLKVSSLESKLFLRSRWSFPYLGS